MDNQVLFTFLILVFIAVLLLAQSLLVPTFGTARQESRRVRQRLGTLADDAAAERTISLLRDDYYRKLSAPEQWLESLPGLRIVAAFIERTGHGFPAYRLLLLCLAGGSLGGMLVWGLTRNPWLTVLVAGALAWSPVLKLRFDMTRRFEKFEEQLPEALDVITRALRAGYPFNESLKVVATEMEAPIGKEFGQTFDQINYGVDMRWALRNLVARVPSLSLMAVVTTVLVQRETGGNLAETLQTISGVIRGRFRFHRKVRSFTAEARLSAWILALVPFVLFAAITATSTDYALMLIQDPNGRKLLMVALGLLVAGNLWIKKLLAIQV